MDNSIEDKAILNIDSDKILNTISAIKMELNASADLSFKTLKSKESAVLIIDMIKGFAEEGALSSERINKLVPKISQLLSSSKDAKKVFIGDSHTKDSVEFLTYPIHAVSGTEESKIVEELYQYFDENSVLIKKNSTNAMMTEALRAYLDCHSEIKNFIIVGDCTDICVLQCALSLKAYFNELNISKKVIVPYTYVDTYDLDVNHHEAELMNLFALYNMKLNGIELYRGLTF